MNYNYIVNPLTNRKCSIYSRNGQKILNQYLIQDGGNECGFNPKTNRCSKTAKENPEKCELGETGRCRKKKHPTQRVVTREEPKPPTPKPPTPKPPTPKAATPKAATPKPPTPKPPTPKPPTPKAPTPKAATPKAATPKAATPRAPTPKAATPKPIVQNLKQLFDEHTLKINNLLLNAREYVCIQAMKNKDDISTMWVNVENSEAMEHMISIGQDFYRFYQTRHPLGLIYANLYTDFVCSKLMHICLDNVYLSDDPKYKDYKYKLGKKQIPFHNPLYFGIPITETRYINSIKQNPYHWVTGIEPQIYWESIDFNHNRILLLRELHNIKADFGRRIFNAYVEQYNSHMDIKKHGTNKEFDNIRPFLKMYFLSKRYAPQTHDLAPQHEIDEEYIMDKWNWNEIGKQLTVRHIGTLLSETIEEAGIERGLKAHASGWGMFRYFNNSQIKKDDPYKALPGNSCSCICNSLLFITILLLTGYESKCIFARMDRDDRDQVYGRATHWGVDLQCHDMTDTLTESFYKCGLIRLGNLCTIDKNIFNRYTSDIIYYYKNAIETRIATGLDNTNKNPNYILKAILQHFKDNIQKFVRQEPCRLEGGPEIKNRKHDMYML
uniref:Uncharacterized protein n=1 Tax=viral metagenome TaxID=1070528 RepID=A0A6C0JEL1_9ZZZZ